MEGLPCAQAPNANPASFPYPEGVGVGVASTGGSAPSWRHARFGGSMSPSQASTLANEEEIIDLCSPR